VKALRQLFGLEPRVDYARLIREGAQVIDVRPAREFEQEHLAGAVNIPIETLRLNFHLLAEKHRVIIACCNDGSKSWYAKNLLDANAYRHVYDAGNWKKLEQSINENN
jgi:rhodanese-related sulfurtransferase